MRPTLLLFALAFAGCASSSVAVAPPPPPTVRVEADPNPVPVRVETLPIEVPPTEPPPTPTRRIDERSVYEQDRVAVWTLANGLTVVYAWDDEATDYASRVSSAGLAGRPAGALVIRGARSSSTDRAPRLDEVVEGAAETAASAGTFGTSVFLHGALGPEWVEPTVAAVLGNVASGRGEVRAGVPSGVEVDWDDLPALWVAAAVVRARDPGASVVYDPRGRASATASPDALAPASDRQIRDARASLSVSPDERADNLLAALDALFQLPGRYLPARPVADARDLGAQIARVPPDRVNAVLSSLARAAR